MTGKSALELYEGGGLAVIVTRWWCNRGKDAHPLLHGAAMAIFSSEKYTSNELSFLVDLRDYLDLIEDSNESNTR